MAENTTPAPTGDDVALIEQLRHAQQRVRDAMTQVIVGQQEVLDELLIALFAGGHVILEGVPGLAKTLMISSLSKCLGLDFARIQFTPDLMPSDITGTEVIQEDRASGERVFRFIPGPVFTNVLLADEINRTPPKTQAALLEAMQEGQVSIGGESRPIAAPLFVLATQNPIEQEGTYPLPEAQQDRFMFKVFVRYPSYDDEYRIAEQTTAGERVALQAVLQRDEILTLQQLVRRVPAPPSVIHYALRLVRGTRPEEASGAVADVVRRLVSFGAGPRAAQFLLLGAKARAALAGRVHASIEDVRQLAKPVLRHRIVTNYAAEAEGYTTDRLIEAIVADVDAGDPTHAAIADVTHA